MRENLVTWYKFTFAANLTLNPSVVSTQSTSPRISVPAGPLQFSTTIEPLHNGHTGDRRKWPLWRGGHEKHQMMMVETNIGTTLILMIGLTFALFLLNQSKAGVFPRCAFWTSFFVLIASLYWLPCSVIGGIRRNNVLVFGYRPKGRSWLASIGLWRYY